MGQPNKYEIRYRAVVPDIYGQELAKLAVGVFFNDIHVERIEDAAAVEEDGRPWGLWSFAYRNWDVWDDAHGALPTPVIPEHADVRPAEEPVSIG